MLNARLCHDEPTDGRRQHGERVRCLRNDQDAIAWHARALPHGQQDSVREYEGHEQRAHAHDALARADMRTSATARDPHERDGKAHRAERQIVAAHGHKPRGGLSHTKHEIYQRIDDVEDKAAGGRQRHADVLVADRPADKLEHAIA